MTMDESEKDDLRVIPFVCFETWRFKRTAAKLGALLLIPAALLLISVVLYCSWIAVALPLQFAVPFIAIMGAVVLCIATYCYQRVLLGLRFCVIFHRDYLQVGRGLVRRIFAYEEVDRVQAEREAGLRIGSGRNTTTVSLDSEEKADCIAVLRQCCPNALFVDEMGREHLPVSPTCPERTLTGIEHHHRRKAWLNALAGCGAAYCAFHFGLKGRNVLIFGLFIGLCICLCLHAAWRWWLIARAIRRKRIGLSASGDPTKIDDSSSVSSGSSPGADGV